MWGHRCLDVVYIVCVFGGVPLSVRSLFVNLHRVRDNRGRGVALTVAQGMQVLRVSCSYLIVKGGRFFFVDVL